MLLSFHFPSPFNKSLACKVPFTSLSTSGVLQTPPNSTRIPLFSSPSPPSKAPPSPDLGTVPSPRSASPNTAWDTTSKKPRDAAVSSHCSVSGGQRTSPLLPHRFLQTQLTKSATSTPAPFLPSPPTPTALRGCGHPCPQTGSKHADPAPPHPRLRPFPSPSPPRCHLPPRREWGRGEEERSRGGGFGPGRLSAPGGRGRGQRQRRRSVSPRRRQRRRRRRPTPAGTHRLHCPPAPPPFRLPPPGPAPSPSPRPSPSRTAPRKVPPAPPRTRAEKCPLPRPRRPARRGTGDCPSPPRRWARRREGPAPLQGNVTCSPSRNARDGTNPAASSSPSPAFPERHRPQRPAHQVASPPRPRPSPEHFTMGPPTASTTSCFAWTRPRGPRPGSSPGQR